MMWYFLCVVISCNYADMVNYDEGWGGGWISPDWGLGARPWDYCIWYYTACTAVKLLLTLLVCGLGSKVMWHSPGTTVGKVKVKHCFPRGHFPVSADEVLEHYGGTHVPMHVMDRLPSSGNWKLTQFLDLFSIPEATLLADVLQVRRR